MGFITILSKLASVSIKAGRDLSLPYNFTNRLKQLFLSGIELQKQEGLVNIYHLAVEKIKLLVSSTKVNLYIRNQDATITIFKETSSEQEKVSMDLVKCSLLGVTLQNYCSPTLFKSSINEKDYNNLVDIATPYPIIVIPLVDDLGHQIGGFEIDYPYYKYGKFNIFNICRYAEIYRNY